MDVENTKTQMRKGILDYCILAILKDGEAYSTDVIAQLKEAKMIVVEGTVYPLLTRLKNVGALQYKWEESTSGPPRKYYSLTKDGLGALNELSDTWNQLKNAVNTITKS
ncbi:MAG: PadR family transcriptional regulator PadR [Chitinophagales bacterium]|jgi:PadR family transcriptional regulator PadR